MDFSKLDLLGLQKARADIMAAAKATELPPSTALIRCIDRLIDRALAAQVNDDAQTPKRS